MLEHNYEKGHKLYKFGQTMHSVKRNLTTENRTCAIRPTAIQSHSLPRYMYLSESVAWLKGDTGDQHELPGPYTGLFLWITTSLPDQLTEYLITKFHTLNALLYKTTDHHIIGITFNLSFHISTYFLQSQKTYIYHS